MEVHSYSYSLPYLIIGIISLCIAIYAQRTSKYQIPLFTLSILLSVFLGLRGYVLTDFMNYRPFFDNLNPIMTLTNDELLRYEPGFVIYSSLFKTLINNYFAWVFFNTLIDIIVLNYIFKKYSISIYLSWFFFLAYMGILMEFNLYRNMKAIDLFLLSIPYIQNRKLTNFFLLNLLGVFFHASALIFIPTYFFISKKIEKKYILAIFFITNIIYLFQKFPTSYILDILANINPLFKVLKYGDGAEQIYGLSFGYIERTLTFIFCFLYYDKLAILRQSNIFFCNSFFCYYILFHIFADVPAFTSRIPLLFIYSYWIIIPNLMGLIKSKYKASWYACILTFGMFKLATGTSTITYKYDNILFEIESFETRENNAYNEWDS